MEESRALILMYHRIAEEVSDPWSLCVSPANFSQQLQVLKRLGSLLHVNRLVNELENGKLSDRSVAITFDDGYVDNLYNAKPLLEAHDVPATIFLVTNSLQSKKEFWFEELEALLLRPGALPRAYHLMLNGASFEWDLENSANYGEDSFLRYRDWRALEPAPTPRHSLYFQLWKKLRPLPDMERRRILDEMWASIGTKPRVRPTHCALSTEEVSRIAEGGIFEIGSHTRTHPQLSQLTDDEQMREIKESKNFLEELIEHPVNSFAYPYGWHGDYSAVSVNCVRQAGYSGACTTIPGAVGSNTHPLQLNRLAVENWDGSEFERRLQNWLQTDVPT